MPTMFRQVSLAALALASVLPVSALAQTAPANEEADRPSPESDIVVTGTRIVRDGYQSPTPLTVLTVQDIQNSSPTNNVADFVNQLPSLAGSTRPANSRLNLSSGQAGVNALNLRNLGETRTLILVDGRRSVASTITGLVDVNTIPQALISGIEVVTGGASAAYGSDAVAGVVNFKLDKKYTGLKVSADSGITDKGDGGNYSFSVAGGMAFAGGRGHILLSGEIAHKAGIFQVDRDWNATGYVRIQNPAYGTGAGQTTSVPQYFLRRQVGSTTSTPGGIILANSGTIGTVNTLRGTYFGSGGSVNQYQFGALTFPAQTSTSSAAPTLTQGGDWRLNDTGRNIGLDPLDDRRGLFGRLSYEVVDGIELFAEAGYNKQHVLFNAGPNLSSCTTAVVGNIGAASTTGGCTLAPDNAYLVQALGAARLVGVTSVAIGTSSIDFPYRKVDSTRQVQRYALGGEGQFQAFGKNATWNLYGQYGRAKLHEGLGDVMNFRRAANAVDAVFAPAGNAGGYAAGSIQCRINVDAITTNDDRACVPINRLGIGVANPAALAYLLGNPYRDEVYQQWNAAFNLSVTPFATWAGDVSIAVGAEYRREKISGFVPVEYQPLVTASSTTNLWSVGNYLPSNGSFNVKEAYLEAVVPVGLGLELNGAVRGTDYSFSGYVTTWKGGATWQPIPDIRLRATRSRDIRAPNLAELYQAGSSNSDAVRNPFFGVGTGVGPNGGTYPSATISYSATATGNLNLQPEVANSLNLGGVLTPRFLPGFAFSVDYFRIDLKGAIDTLSAQDIIDRCFEGRQEYCAAITQDPASASRILFRTQPFNYVRRLTRGIDFDASYRLPLNKIFGNVDGSFTLHGVATRYIDNIINPGIPNAVILNTVGTNSGQSSTPTWIYRVTAGYDTPSFSVTAVGRGVSSGKRDAGGIECTTACPVSTASNPTYGDPNYVPGTFYVDLNLTQKVRIDDRTKTEFFFNVTNLFDRGAMVYGDTGLAANSTFSDLLGRQFRVGVRAEFK